MKQLSDPESDAFKSFMSALGEGPAEEPGIGERIGSLFDRGVEAMKGEDVPEEDIERFDNTEWELPSGEQVKTRARRGKFFIRTQPRWRKDQSIEMREKVEGSYPTWVEIPFEELIKLGLTEIQR